MAAKPAPGADVFADGAVHRLRIEIAPRDVAALRRDSRAYVPATVREGPAAYTNVGIHLKGSTGSFRSIDDKPGLTLNFAKFEPGQHFHGLQRIHLNNSVEDPSYLNELIGGELFRAAGVPAPRVAHALVELNGRNLGLYVLKEGFTEDFLGLYFTNTHGNLYDTGAGHDIDEPLERDSGAGPDDRRDLQALAAAAREPDPDHRWDRLQQVLDWERFLSFMALEVMIGHRDGYCLARNNFRVFHDLDSDRIVFFPHGMDQLFGRADLTWQPHMAGLLAKAVMDTPAGRQSYRERFTSLLTNVFHVSTLTNRVSQLAGQLRPALTRAAARDLEQNARLVQRRIAQRHAHLLQQLAEPELTLLAFSAEVAKLDGWRRVAASPQSILAQGAAPDGRPALSIKLSGDTSPSWRTRVLLRPGRYRFEGLVWTTGVVPLSYGKNQGAGLRVSGFPSARPHHLTGDTPWTPVEAEFQLAGDSATVELVCELRARQGAAWFDLASLQLVQLR